MCSFGEGGGELVGWMSGIWTKCDSTFVSNPRHLSNQSSATNSTGTYYHL